MEDLDFEYATGSPNDDEELFLQHVIRGEYDLLYLDTYLRELLGKQGVD